MFVVPASRLPTQLVSPQISGLSPASGAAGAQVLIYGTNFSTTTGVRFGNVNAAFTVSSDKLIIATVPSGATTAPLTVTTTIGTAARAFTVFYLSPPANDNFTSSQTLTGNAAVIVGSTAGATKQSGEPNHAGNPGGHSVWYRWTAPNACVWSLDSTGSDFNTLLGVYTGSSLSGLSVVASNSVAGGVVASGLSFNATAGTTYLLALDGQSGAFGNFLLRLMPATPATFTIYFHRV